MLALIVYLLTGLALSFRLLPSQRAVVKCWLGLVFGCVLLMWLPCLAAFLFGFSKTAQDIALGVALAVAAGLFTEYLIKNRGRLRELRPCITLTRIDSAGLMVCAAATALCAYILYTHVLLPKEDGSLWVGQSTYGDLAMHLGFIESLYRQGTFPPEYSIYPGQQLNYPFVVDAASASLRFFGLSLRLSVIAPSIVMLFSVFWGFWLLAERLTKKLAPTLMSWLLFVMNGGLGFLFFFGEYSFSDIFTGFYTTPTNLTSRDIRWVNVICDMLIPQRTTMAGWCVILAAIWLLITVLDRTLSGQGRRETVVLAVLAGAMPMIHTHSFLALGILSAAWFFSSLSATKKRGQIKNLVRNYILYGGICLALALPQLFKWTMDSVSTGNLLKLHLGWVVGANGAIKSPLLFYLANVGVVFAAVFPMLPSLRGERLTLFIGAAAIFVLSNLVAFQPNLYDNNKLLYIWFMLTDILVCGWLWDIIALAPKRYVRAAVAGALVFLGTFSGALSILREAISEYQLLSPAQVEAASFIIEETEPDSLFLTGTNHANPVPILTGRNITCGSSLYLFFHGVDYQEREAAVSEMYRGGEAFLRQAEALGIDYVYISSYEYGDYIVNYEWFAENYPLIYQHDGISIFQISEDYDTLRQ